jgi:PIN domain nuclease of toxin-antitoxin system
VKLLLDTQAFLWFIAGDAALSAKGRSAIEDQANTKVVSVVSIWEIAIKFSLGKLSLAQPFEQLIPDQLRINGFELLGLTVDHAAVVAKLPFHHRDPFDRMIVAQSLVEKVAIVSSDSPLDAYGITRVW